MKPLLEVKNLKKHFSAGKEILKAVDDVSFVIHPGETLGLVGESGCGKSTTGKTLLRLEEPTSGNVLFKGKDLLSLNPQELKSFRKEAQIIFQDPYSSLNPRMTASDIIAEGLEIHNLAQGNEKKERVDALLHLVGLPLASGSRFPHEFSGGQRQRIGIARALSLDPQFIVCDEPISALDVSVQAQIVNLLRRLQLERSLTYLFISHDLRMVKYLSTRVAVMYLGHMIELSATDDLYAHPLHPYTQALLSAIPIPDPLLERKRSRIVLTGDVPSPINPPKGCVFCTRCPKAMKICHEERPSWKEAAPGHFTACHLY